MGIIRWLLGNIILFLDAVFSPISVKRAPEAQAKIDSAVATMALYQYAACPFCVKVRRFLKRSGVTIPLRDAKQESFKEELRKGGGKVQVPCLRIEKNGSVQWMYESNDIINYLKSYLAL